MYSNNKQQAASLESGIPSVGSLVSIVYYEINFKKRILL